MRPDLPVIVSRDAEGVTVSATSPSGLWGCVAAATDEQQARREVELAYRRHEAEERGRAEGD